MKKKLIKKIKKTLNKYDCNTYDFDEKSLTLSKNISYTNASMHKVISKITGDLVKKNIDYKFSSDQSLKIFKK